MLTTLQQEALTYIAHETLTAKQQFHRDEARDAVIDRT